MPNGEHEHNIQPSILDRLLDDDDASGRPRHLLSDRFQSLSQLKQAVTRDLEALLNTRRESLTNVPVAYTEVQRSLLCYGLPDFTTLTLSSPEDRNRIRRVLEQAITLFEPRLDRVRVMLEDRREHNQTLRFRIEALLRVAPAPEAVTFDAMLQLSTQRYQVQGPA